MSEIAGKATIRHSETSSTYTRQHDHNGSHLVAFENCDRCSRFPNRWSKIREYIREPAAEFVGTLILVLFGCGSNCQVVLSSNSAVSSPKGDYFSTNIGWAIGIGMGVWISGSISGGHINPAVTLALASVRNFPWKKVPSYILAQLLGGICGAGIVYANYYRAITIYEGGSDIRTVSGTGRLFGTYPADFTTPVSAFFVEFLGAAMLIVAILLATDKRNGTTSPLVVPLAVFFILLAIGVSFGLETGNAINPARDLGPRILTAMVGYGRAVFDYRHQYWIWGPILGPILGMQIGALAYDSLLYTGADSIVNKPSPEAEKRHLDNCAHHRNVVPAAVDAV